VREAIFLDRDGVLNEPIIRDYRPYPPASLQELRIYSEAGPALSLLKEAGFLLLVVTNQPDVARGAQTREMVNAINSAIGAVVPVDEFFVCWHDDSEGCDCRKPKPGLVLKSAAKYGIDLSRSFLIGDRWRDVDAGAAAGCRTVMIDRGYREKSPLHPPDLRTNSLKTGVDWILSNLAGIKAST
jgi:D-glycero-D-manno-heptose 1,7-bisphosphate phosphatase